MKKTLYEINWHSTKVFSHCTVTPITVLREGVLPGCTGVSITAKDSKGREFIGSPENYYETEEIAWAAVKNDIENIIKTIEKQNTEAQGQLNSLRDYLKELDSKLSGAKADDH